jgi:subtilisin family serine protease
VVPDDPLFRLQWALQNTGQVFGGLAGTPGADVGAPEAWQRTTGSAAVTVAVVDSGVDAAHPDLAPNLVPGRDFVEDDATPQDGDGHGTHVAGTIGARGGDGAGVAGVSWSSRLLPLRVLDARGSGTVSAAIRAYAWAALARARVVNLSFGGPTPSRAERDALAALPGVLFVAAAGNDGADVDRAGSYPCGYDLEHVLCVAASDPRDGLAPFSDRGAIGVDLAAPGVSVVSTLPGARFGLLSGTSMAAPHVSGAAALLLAADPSLTPAGLRGALLAGVTRRPALAGRVASGGRLDVAGALATLDPGQVTAPAADPPAGDPGGPPADPPAPAPAAPTAPAAAAPAGPPAPAPASAPAPAAPAAPVRPGSPTTAESSSDAAPVLGRVALPRRGLAAVLRRGLAVRAALAGPATLRVEVRRAGRRLAARTVRVRAAGARTITVRLPARARRALRARRRAVLTVRVTATDAAGAARTTTRRLTLS